MARTVNDKAPLNNPQPPDHSHIPCLADQWLLLQTIEFRSPASAGRRQDTGC